MYLSFEDMPCINLPEGETEFSTLYNSENKKDLVSSQVEITCFCQIKVKQ